MKDKSNIIPIFIPHQGCGHDCIFCNQKKITGQSEKINIDYEINRYLSYFKDKSDIELAFYGGSFTGLDEDLMISYLDQVKPYLDQGIISSIRLSTRPDYISNHILNILEKYQVTTIELGVQSMDDEVLKANLRGTSKAEIIYASQLIKESGFNLGLQMMTGLYGSTKDKDINTAFEIARLGPDFVRIYPTMVIEYTFLYELYKEHKYIPMTVEECISLLEPIVSIFEISGIDIIRLGLYSDGLENFIGPFHPALRQIVYSNLYLKIIKAISKELGHSNLEIISNYKDLDYLVGYKASNRKELEKNGITCSYTYKDLSRNNFIISNEGIEYQYNFRDSLRALSGDVNET